MAREKFDLSKTSFRDLRGQDQAASLLASALHNQRVPHAYLFVGPEGVGKKAAALQWAKVLNCQSPLSPTEACESCNSCQKITDRNHPDVLWIDYEYQAHLLKESPEKQKSLKIDTIRQMEHALRLKPLEGRVKIAFLEPAHQLVEVAAHALLKILEEPPPLTHLVLLTWDASQLLGTIRSRCQTVRFCPLPVELLATCLQERQPMELPEKIQKAAQNAEGSLQKALKILEEEEELEFDWESASLSELMVWCEQFGRRKLGREGTEQFLKRLLVRFQREVQSGQGDPEELQRVLDALHQIKQNVTPQLVLEVLLLRMRWDRKHRSAAPA